MEMLKKKKLLQISLLENETLKGGGLGTNNK